METFIKNTVKTVILILLIFNNTLGFSQKSEEYINQAAERTLKEFNVPGIAVGVIKDGKIIHSGGYGVRSIEDNTPVDANTLFAVASNSKAFTSAALAILVDEKKITWETRVIDIIPEFRLYSPYVTEEFNIKDLLCHRSGLGLGAGDLMIWPDGSNFTTSDIIHNLRYLKPVSSFRTKYDYDNLLYIVAGEVVKRVSGTSWEDFVESKIMAPLGMKRSAASFEGLKDLSNMASSHIEYEGKVNKVPMTLMKPANGAAGVITSVNDLFKWVYTQLNRGISADGIRIFSEKVHTEMWTPQTIIPVRGSTPFKTNFKSYALGWSVYDANGYKIVTHTGMLAGVVTQVIMVPDLKLGVIVLTNNQVGEAFNSISYTILDHYFGINGRDRVKEFGESYRKAKSNANDILQKVWEQTAKFDNQDINSYSNYTGSYLDNWFGKVTISIVNGKLVFASERSPKMLGDILPYKNNTFVVKWRDRSFDADAFINFSFDFEGNPKGFTMKAISPLTDFSFDFQDFDFTK